jgi:glycosyltransferase involved in cell wall biosynthesis
MFMQSQDWYGADSALHALMLRHFDRSVVEPYLALTTSVTDRPETSARTQMGSIPNLRIRPTYFGPTVNDTTFTERLDIPLTIPRLGDSLLRLAATIRRERIQILHGTEKPRDIFYAELLSRMTGVKTVVHLHVGFEEWISPLAKWAIRRADGMVGVSRFTAQSMLAAGLPPRRVYHVLNALDLTSSRWDPATDGSGVRAELGIRPDAPVIGIVSRLFLWKGHTYLVNAMRQVADEVPEARLLIVGDDDLRAHPGGTSYRAELGALVESLGLQEQVIFTPFRTDVPQVMAAFDVFAMPTWDEPFGMVFVEAMAMKRPVVAWARGGPLEIIADGETGFLPESGDVDGLARALLRLIRDPDLRRRMGEAGRRRAEQRFNPQRMCQDMVEVYRDVLGEAPATANVQSHLHAG